MRRTGTARRVQACAKSGWRGPRDHEGRAGRLPEDEMGSIDSTIYTARAHGGHILRIRRDSTSL